MLIFVEEDLLAIDAEYVVLDIPIGWRSDPVPGLDARVSAMWPDARAGLYEHVRSRRLDGGDLCAVAPTSARPGVIYLACRPSPERATMAFISRAIRNLVGWCRREKVSRVALPLITTDTSEASVARTTELYRHELSRVRTEYIVSVPRSIDRESAETMTD